MYVTIYYTVYICYVIYPCCIPEHVQTKSVRAVKWSTYQDLCLYSRGLPGCLYETTWFFSCTSPMDPWSMASVWEDTADSLVIIPQSRVLRRYGWFHRECYWSASCYLYLVCAKAAKTRTQFGIAQSLLMCVHQVALSVLRLCAHDFPETHDLNQDSTDLVVSWNKGTQKRMVYAGKAY